MALFQRVFEKTRREIVSSTYTGLHRDLPDGDQRDIGGTKMWNRLVRGGRGTYGRETDRFRFVPLPHSIRSFIRFCWQVVRARVFGRMFAPVEANEGAHFAHIVQ